MIPNEAVELFDKYCSAFSKKSAEGMAEIFSESGTLLGPGSAEPISGRKMLKRRFAEVMPYVETPNVHTLAIWEKGDETVVEWDYGYTDKRDGKAHRYRGITILKVNKGLVEEMREYH